MRPADSDSPVGRAVPAISPAPGPRGCPCFRRDNGGQSPPYGLPLNRPFIFPASWPGLERPVYSHTTNCKAKGVFGARNICSSVVGITKTGYLERTQTSALSEMQDVGMPSVVDLQRDVGSAVRSGGHLPPTEEQKVDPLLPVGKGVNLSLPFGGCERPLLLFVRGPNIKWCTKVHYATEAIERDEKGLQAAA